MPTEQPCLTVLDRWLWVLVVLGPEQLVVMGPMKFQLQRCVQNVSTLCFFSPPTMAKSKGLAEAGRLLLAGAVPVEFIFFSFHRVSFLF